VRVPLGAVGADRNGAVEGGGVPVRQLGRAGAGLVAGEVGLVEEANIHARGVGEVVDLPA
jgi:hypothetical protein